MVKQYLLGWEFYLGATAGLSRSVLEPHVIGTAGQAGSGTRNGFPDALKLTLK
jgi:hypothetical protein